MSGGLGPRTRGAVRAPRAWCSHAAGGCGRIGRPLPPRGSGVSPPEKFTNFTCKILNFGAHLSKIINLLCLLLFVNFSTFSITKEPEYNAT
jgi:hypothetical protein